MSVETIFTDNINCKYHSKNLNVDWCHNCGNPICEECLSKIPLIFSSDYPILCPKCKREKLTHIIKWYALIDILFLLPIPFFLFFANNIFEYFILISFSIILVIYCLNLLYSYFTNIKKYNEWVKNIDEREILSKEIKELIQNQTLIPCKYHKESPGINICEKCNSNVCIECSIIFQFSNHKILCLKCYWNKYRRYSIIGIILITILISIFVSLFINILIVFFEKVNISFYIILLYIIGVLVLSLILSFKKYFKDKNKYKSWKKELEKIF